MNLEQLCQQNTSRKYYSQVIENVDGLDVSGKSYVRVLFIRCRIINISRGLLKNCRYEFCSLEPPDIRGLVGVTLTLDCNQFNRGLGMSDATSDAMLFLTARGSKNQWQRDKILASIDPETVKLFDRLFPET